MQAMTPNNKFAALRNFRPGKTWIILGVALTIGGLAAYFARSYLTQQMAAIEAQAKGKSVNVVVAKGDLPKGATLSRANVALRPIPLEFAHSVAVLPEEFDRIDGQQLAYPVKGGEMILWGLMETQRMPTFSARVAPGHRAMTVQVDEINSISGMLEPGDTIDLIASIEQRGKRFTFPLLQGVLVMATGQRSADDPKNGERRQFSTVTIDTTPEQSEYLIAARENGKLTALLRNPQDKQPFGAKTYDVAVLLGLKEGPAAFSGEREVAVLYGGSGGVKVPPDAMRLVPGGTGPDAAGSVPSQP